jgi:hypothetical protein
MKRESRDDTVPTKNDKSVFESADTHLAAVAQLTEAELPPELLKLAQEQQRNLQDLVGIGSAWLRKQPDPVDVDKLEEMYKALPLLGYSGITNPTYDETIESFSIAKSFLAQLIGFAVAGGSGLDSFRNFLAGLQGDISMGIQKIKRTFPSFMMSMVFKQHPTTKLLIVRLDGYKVDFTLESKIIKTSCASHEEIDIRFSYKSYLAEFEYYKLDRPEIKKQWDDFILSSDTDDFDKARNKFRKDDVHKEKPA